MGSSSATKVPLSASRHQDNPVHSHPAEQLQARRKSEVSRPGESGKRNSRKQVNRNARSSCERTPSERRTKRQAKQEKRAQLSSRALAMLPVRATSFFIPGQWFIPSWENEDRRRPDAEDSESAVARECLEVQLSVDLLDLPWWWSCELCRLHELVGACAADLSNCR